MTVQKRTICMFSGLITDIPLGWHLCDGLAGTLDLRDKFIIGAGSTYAPGAGGGAASHSWPHSHGMGGITVPDDGHTHTISGNVDAYAGGATATLGLPNSAGSIANHVHAVSKVVSTPHTHTINGDTDEYTLNVSNLPVYYALAFVEKIAKSPFDECVRQVSVGSDDADDTGTGGFTISLVNNHGSTGGWRFANVTVPNGATIKLAYLVLWTSWAGVWPHSFTLWGELSASAATFAPADLPSARAKGAVSTTQAPGIYNIPQAYNVTTQIQEIVDQAGWASGNALALLAEAENMGGDLRFYSFEGYGPWAAKLIVEHA